MRFLLAALLILAPGLAGAQAVILWNGAAPAPGTTWHEEMTMRLEGGTFSLGINGVTVSGSASAHTHDSVDRTFTAPDRQKVEVLDSARSFRFSFGTQGSPPKDEAGHLLGKKLLGTKTGERWNFTLASKQEPDSAEKTALRQFAAYTQAVESFGLLYGNTPRKVGDTWKPDLGALKKTVPDIDADLECKLEEVKTQGADEMARISVTGHLFANIKEKGKLQIAINAVIHRSLHDMVDLETAINGNAKYHGTFGKGKEDQKGGTEADVAAPLTVLRTVKVLKH